MDRPTEFQKSALSPKEYIFELERYIDWLEKGKEIITLQKFNPHAVYCGCIDKCSAQRNTHFCLANRNCIHKIKK